MASPRHHRRLALLLGTLLWGCGDNEPAREPGPIHATVMSFNVLCSFCDASYDPWDERVAYIADVVKRHDPDLIGFQEFLTGDEVQQVADLTPGYGTVYLTDPDGPNLDEYADALIFYRTSKFEVLQTGFYFLSDTPDEYWSLGWAETQLWRLVAWAHLRQRSDGREMFFATTHVDNNSPNQEMSAPVILGRTEPWASTMPAVVVGDFNSQPSSTAYGILTQGAAPGGFVLLDTFDRAETFESIHNQPTPPEWDPDSRIDHIFVNSPTPWSCSHWAVDQTVYGASQKYPSDHFAIAAAVTLE